MRGTFEKNRLEAGPGLRYLIGKKKGYARKLVRMSRNHHVNKPPADWSDNAHRFTDLRKNVGQM